MADTEPQTKDPLKHYDGLSLFPQTLSSLSLPNPPQDPLHFHNFLKSLPVRDHEKLMKEANNILDSTTKMQNPEVSEVVVEKNVKFPRGRRPGLDRKRPRFSIVPNIRQQSIVNLEPSLDFDKLKDPEEFFSAYERLENAKKEIAKQTGRSFADSDQYNVFNVPQSQRPGIEGRSRTVKYTHLYPTRPSQDTPDVDILSDNGSQQEVDPTDDPSQQIESVDAASEEMELTGSIVKVEKRVNKLLDDLLASEELEGDGSLSLLQDKLQIEPLHIEKLNIPELQDIQMPDFKASQVNLSKHRNILSDINNLLKTTMSKTPMKLKNVESSVHSVGSPTPPKSPFASLSLLKQRIFQSKSPSDPFSAEDIDLTPARNASHAKTNINSNSVNIENALGVSGDLNSQTNEENDGTIGSMNSTKTTVEDFSSSFKMHTHENLVSLGTGGEIDPMIESSSQADVDADLPTSRPIELEHVVEDVPQEAVTSAQPNQEIDEFLVNPSKSMQKKLDQADPEASECLEIQGGAPEPAEGTALERHQEEVQEPIMVSMDKQSKAKVNRQRRWSSKDLSRKENLADPARVENQATDMCPGHLDRAREQTQGTAQENNERSKEKSVSNKERKRKTLSTRQSLAGCGMSWQTGVRRSTRIRSRPLEYWKGEKFLYGRIHDSLATVIGVKYASPGNPTLKVKSFVSDEYKGLVEQAALY